MNYREASRTGGVLVAAVGRHVAGAAAEDGRVLWKHAIGSKKDDDVLRIAVHEDRLIAGRANDLVCIEQLSGTIAWKVECPIAIGTLATEAGKIFAASGGEVACFDRDGRLLWHELVLGFTGPGALAAGGIVVYG